MLGLLIGLAVILSLYLLGSQGAWKDEFIVKAAPFVLAFIGFPAIFVWNLLAAPARLDAEQKDKIAALNAALAPTLRISIAEGSGFSRSDYGVTSTTLNGTKHTTVTGRGMFYGLLLNCENISASAIEKCEAFLVGVRRQGLSDSFEPIKHDAIALRWMPIHKDATYQTSIPSQGHRSAVALINWGGHRVRFPTDEISADLIDTFETPGTYLIRYMVCPYGAAAVPFTVRLTTGENPSIEPVTED